MEHNPEEAARVTLAMHTRSGVVSLPYAWRAPSRPCAKLGWDAIIVHRNEADFANARYLSDYWPLFESAGILVPTEGDAILLVEPTSETVATDRSRIAKIRSVLANRESAEPDYPELATKSFGLVFDEATGGKPIRKLGLVSYSIMPRPVYDGLRAALPDADFVHAVYAFSGPSTRNAICRPSHRPLQLGTMTQLNTGGRLAGYSPSVGRPVCIRPIPAETKRLVPVGLDAHEKTMEILEPAL